jgi:poly-gamma-glutamate synthesis protein (capsule biosynthesis protein)
VASIHWGGNWGYDIPAIHRQFAHQLIDEAGVDVIHGHSSHHPLGIEVYKGRLIIYGCGDLLNDYEGIGGYRAFRGDLALMYFPSLHPVTGELLGCQMTLLEIRRFQLHRALAKDARWLCSVLNREGEKLGTSVASSEDNRLMLAW